MSVREYIGARYVPLFADPIEWDNSKTYEPLTIVYYQGNSYTSRQAVPTGIAITNEDYWALTGNYNAQIEAYREEVRDYSEQVITMDGQIDGLEDALPIADFNENNTVSDALEALETGMDTAIDGVMDVIGGSYTAQNTVDDAIAKTNDLIDGDVILIGDSYAAGWTPDGDVTGWTTLVATYLANFGINCYHTGTGGVGFATSTTYKSQLQTLLGTLTQSQIERVKTIVFCGGANDRGASEVDITTGMSTTKAYVLDNLPNVKRVLIANVGMVVQGLTTGVWANATFGQMTVTTLRYASAALASGLGVMIPHGNGVLRSNTLFSSDYVHPNQLGQKQIAQYIISALTGIEFVNTVPITYVDGLVGVLVEEGRANIYIAPVKLYNVNISSALLDGYDNHHIKLFDYTRNAALQVNNEIRIPCTLQFHGATTSGGTKYYYALDGCLIFKNDGGCYVSAIGINDSKSNYLTLYDINSIVVKTSISDFSLGASMDRH